MDEYSPGYTACQSGSDHDKLTFLCANMSAVVKDIGEIKESCRLTKGTCETRFASLDAYILELRTGEVKMLEQQKSIESKLVFHRNLIISFISTVTLSGIAAGNYLWQHLINSVQK